jgi:hypothetical protein
MEMLRPEVFGALFLNERSININFAVAARVRGPLSREGLEAALAALVRRHPLIGIRAVAAPAAAPAAAPEGQPHFETDGVPPIPLLEFERPDDNAWVAEMSREIQVPTPYMRGPLMRCLWLRGEGISDLVLLCDHLMADGKAAVIVLRDLLSFAADPSQDVGPIDSPPLSDLVPAEIADQIREDAADYPPMGPPPEEPAAEPGGEGAAPTSAIEATALPMEDPVLITPFSLTVAETSALVARCRAEGATVQAALCAAFLTPFAEQQPDRPVRRAEIPVDLRPRLSRPVGDAYGCFIGLNEIDVDCSPERGLWDVARDAARALAGMRDRDNFATFLVVAALTGKFPQRGWHTAYDLSISNLGRVDLPASFGPLRVESFYGPLFPATGPTHRILDVATFEGEMTFTYSVRGREVPAQMTRGLELLRSMIG